jgi:hypothetical protein
VTVHVSADADEVPKTSALSSAPASTAISLGRLITAALVLRPTWFVRTPRRKRKGTLRGTDAIDCLPALQFRTALSVSLNLRLSVSTSP